VSERVVTPSRPSRPSRPSGARSVRIAGRLPPAGDRAAARVVPLPAEGDLGSVAAVARALPDPAELAPGTLVLVPSARGGRGGRSLARSVLTALGLRSPVARALRCSALVARGYVDVGAGEDEAREDLAWGYVPTELC
jgi:hypothetical protein